MWSCVFAACAYVWSMCAYHYAMQWWTYLTETEDEARLRRAQRAERDARGW
jgi:hypothetical protein